MNPSLLKSSRAFLSNRGLCGILLPVILLIVVPSSYSQITNAPAGNWYRQKDVSRKWGGVPLADSKKAAADGDVTAQLYLGFAYYYGGSVKPDPMEAKRWFSLAADQGQPGAMLALGGIYRFGEGVPRDLGQAEVWYERALKTGDPRGEYYLGEFYGEEKRDYQKALPLYRHAADAGVSDAMLAMYWVYSGGKGVNRDFAEAKKWLIQAAEAGNAFGECLYGHTFEITYWEGEGANRRLPPPNMEEAVRWYRKSADQNWAGGQYLLGLCYIKGTGLEQDEERGLDWIRKAADQHQAHAMVELAKLYARGIGQPRNDLDRPIHILENLVNARSPLEAEMVGEAYHLLVFRHENGIGTPRDIVASVQQYCRAALDGIEGFSLSHKLDFKPVGKSAADKLVSSPDRPGLLLSFPYADDSSERFQSALSLFLKAASLKSSEAIVRIGDMYRLGEDTPVNPVKAWIWYSLAAQNGARPDYAAKVEEILTNQELAEAKKHLAELAPELHRITSAAN